MLITGTSACSASSSTVSCGPVRIAIAWTIRDSTSAVSRGDSPRDSCSSPSRSTSGRPPSSKTPVSNETRVRVEGRSNTSATLSPASAREPRRSRLSSMRAVEEAVELLGRKLFACQEVACQCESSAGTSTTAATCHLIPPCSRAARACCARPERGATHVQVNRPLLDEFASVLDRHEWDVALLQEAPPRWFAELARRTRATRAEGADLAQLGAAAAGPARGLEPRPDRVQRRRLEPDPRARARDGSSSTVA